jgi:hypothetical protein
MRLNQKNWGDPKKRLARDETVISFYRTHFGQTIPKGRQYWTIAGQCSTDSGTVRPGCEFEHVLSEHLVRPNQFHSAEIEPDIHMANSRIGRGHWHEGDLYKAMVAEVNRGGFNPAVVNADLLLMPGRAAPYIARTIALLTSLDIRNVMVVCNVILRNRQNRSSNEETIQNLSLTSQFRSAFSKGWKLHGEGYTYNGTGGNKTVMGTIILYRK